MLKVALPNKGSLADAATEILREAGYRQRNDQRDLSYIDPSNEVEFYYLRPRDIAIYVGSGELNFGITGRDLLLDSEASASEVMALDIGKSVFRFAATPGNQVLDGKRIATAYPNLVRNFLHNKNVNATLVPLDGAVEGAIKLGVADVIADVVSTGNTLKQAGLQIFGEEILRSEAILIERTGAI